MTYEEALKSDMSNRQIAREYGKNESTVRRARKRLGVTSPYKPSDAPVSGESETHNPDGSSSYVRFSETPWGYEDYREFIRSKGQDPDEVDFTWGWTSNPQGGFWNKLNNVRPKKGVSQDLGIDISDIQKRIVAFNPQEWYEESEAAPEAYVVALADWQLGKCERGIGTEQTVERILKSLDAIKQDIQIHRANGRNLRTLVLANMGDHTENVNGSYASQTYSVDLNMRDQLKLAIELNLKFITELTPLFDKTIYTAALCNHGQLSRGAGRDNVTDDSDNATGFIGDMLAQIVEITPALNNVWFRIPEYEMITTLQVEGTSLAMAHGHKITGKEKAWLDAQSAALLQKNRFFPDVWLTAHKHYASVEDMGPFTRIQATTVDPGSKWFEDMTGSYSKPGTTVFLTSNGDWRDYKIL